MLTECDYRMALLQTSAMQFGRFGLDELTDGLEGYCQLVMVRSGHERRRVVD